LITHIVFFKLKDPSSANLDKAAGVLRALKGKVPTLRSIEVGVDVVRSERSYDVALVSTFDDLAGLEAYRAHQLHVEAANYLRSVSSAIAAVDYQT
jgi:hypothetical protein